MRFLPALAHSLLLLLLLLLTAASAAAQPAGAAAGYVLPANRSVPFLVLRQIPTELASQHAVVLRLFADGRCELERPPIMRGPQRASWTISPGEVASIAHDAIEAGLGELDGSALRASLRAAAAGRDAAVVVQRHDDDIVEYDLTLDDYRGRGRHRHALRLVGLRGDRLRHPDDDRVRRLAALRERLDAMIRNHASFAP